MLIATITALILIFGGENLEFYLTNLKGEVKEHVQDKERQRTILETGEALEEDLKELQEDAEAHFEALILVHNNYHSTVEDYAAAGDLLKADQRRLTQLTLDARDAMKKNMSREEWEAVFAEDEG